MKFNQSLQGITTTVHAKNFFFNKRHNTTFNKLNATLFCKQKTK